MTKVHDSSLAHSHTMRSPDRNGESRLLGKGGQATALLDPVRRVRRITSCRLLLLLREALKRHVQMNRQSAANQCGVY